MKHKNVEVGQFIVAKASAVAHMDIPIVEGQLCEVLQVEPLYYEGALALKVRVGGSQEWVSPEHFRKQK